MCWTLSGSETNVLDLRRLLFQWERQMTNKDILSHPIELYCKINSLKVLCDVGIHLLVWYACTQTHTQTPCSRASPSPCALAAHTHSSSLWNTSCKIGCSNLTHLAGRQTAQQLFESTQTCSSHADYWIRSPAPN